MIEIQTIGFKPIKYSCEENYLHNLEVYFTISKERPRCLCTHSLSRKTENSSKYVIKKNSFKEVPLLGTILSMSLSFLFGNISFFSLEVKLGQVFQENGPKIKC